MKSQQRQRSAVRTAALVFPQPLTAVASAIVVMAASIGPAVAAPQGGQVVAGQASIVQQGSKTTITQTGERAAIDWRSFNVGRGEAVDFKQPGATAVTLNRVTGDDASAILGRLKANGQVYLVNPNGVLFGRDAQVNVAGLVASTANISNADFMAGRLRFDQPGKPGAAVVNEGSITVTEGGLVAFVAPHVANNGIINARLSKVSLAAGDAFVLDLYGDQLVNLIVDGALLEQLTDATGLPLAARLDQTGSVLADGGRVQLAAATARRLVDNVINVSGVVRATSVETRDGVISLIGDRNTRVAVSGTLQADGQRGGRIEVTGREVLLTSTASVDASGTNAGGTIALGGNWQGQGPLAHAQALQVDSGAMVAANALRQGDGGTVSLWSEQSTQFGGTVQSRGGAEGGRGGQVEASSKGQLGFLGHVDLSAPQGRAGSLLLDPLNLTIGDISAGDSQLAAAQIRAFLLSGVSLSLQASNDIVVNSTIDGRGNATGGGLNLEAGNSLRVNQNIVLNDGVLALVARNGTLTTAPDAILATGTGSVLLSGGAGVSVGKVLTGGAVEITSTQGDITVGSAIQGAGNNIPVASLHIDANAGAVRLNGALVQGAANVTAGKDLLLTGDLQTKTGDITLESKTGAVKATIAGEAGGNPQAGDAAIVAGDAASMSSVTVRAAGDVELGEVIAQRGVTITSTQGDVMLLRALGGETTGYAKDGYEQGYQEALKPKVGRLEVSAPQGSVELNGLNLDGNSAATSSDAGLRVVAGHLILSNAKIAINKGNIWLESGATGTPYGGLYVGDSIYSRGLDHTKPDGSREKIGYSITIRAPKLTLFDNTEDIAQLPGIYLIPHALQPDGISYANVYADNEGYLVDKNGTRSPEGYRVVVNKGYADVADGSSPYEISVIQWNPSIDTSHSPILGLSATRIVAKIELSNNAANYRDTESRLVPLTTSADNPPKVAIDSANGESVILGALHLAGNSAIGRQSIKNFVPTTVPLSQADARNNFNATSESTAISEKGILLKILSYPTSADVKTDVWRTHVVLAASGQPLNSSYNFVKDSASESGGFVINDSTGLLSFTESVPNNLWASFGDAVGQQGICTNRCEINYSVAAGTYSDGSKGANILSIHVNGNQVQNVPRIELLGFDQYLSSDRVEEGQILQIRYSPRYSIASGAVIDLYPSNGIYPQSFAVTGHATAADIAAVAMANSVTDIGQYSPKFRLAQQDSNTITIGSLQFSGQTALPVSYRLSGTLVDSISTGTSQGARVLLFDGTLATAQGIAIADQANGTQITGLLSPSGMNDSSTSFTSVGTTFGTGVFAAANRPDATTPDEASRQAGGAHYFSKEDIDDTPTSPMLGHRPAELADMGRSGVTAGATTNLFERRFHLMTSSDKAICAGETKGGLIPSLVACQH